MERCQFKHIFVITMGVLLISLIILTGCTKNMANGYLPSFTEITPPVEVTVDQLYEEYIANEAAADAKYKWKKLVFYEVEVEEVVGRIYVDPHGFDTFLKEYFISGNVKFNDVLDYYVVMQNIKEGYVLNVVGECRGLKEGFVYISDCWVESVEGDLGIGGPGVDFY